MGDGELARMREREHRSGRAHRANRAAAPPWNRSCGGPPRRTTSMPRQNTPREWPVPSAFIAASFAANRAANDEAASRLRRQ